MPLSLRQRLMLTLLPLVILVALLGGAGALLLHRLGGSIDEILRENYESVVAMQNLKEALERIDSSFQFMLVARDMQDAKERRQLEDNAKRQFADFRLRFDDSLKKEQNNITIHPTEDKLVAELTAAAETYRRLGKDFFERSSREGVRNEDYYGKAGLYDTFLHIKAIAGKILDLNQDEMRVASQRASDTARNSLIWFGTGLAASTVLLAFLVWRTAQAILRPLRAVTESALAISAGNLDQLVPVVSGDERRCPAPWSASKQPLRAPSGTDSRSRSLLRFVPIPSCSPPAFTPCSFCFFALIILKRVRLFGLVQNSDNRVLPRPSPNLD